MRVDHKSIASVGPAPVVSAPALLLCELRGVSKSFGHVTALRAVDLAIAPGECLGIVGHNGAGKSTLINLLNGVHRPSEGTFRFDGRDVAAGWTSAEAQRHGVRCVFQELSLVPNLTAIENLRLVAPSLKGWGWRQEAKDLLGRQLAEIFPGSELDLSIEVEKLPIGARQMIEVARAFVHTDVPARLVVLDEPTSALTAHASRQLVEFLSARVRERPAVVLVSHKLAEVLSVAARVIAMKDGRKILDRPARELAREEIVRAMGAVRPEGADGAASRSAPGVVRGSLPAVTELDLGTGSPVPIRRGEIIGFGGLAGHGQSQMLIQLFRAHRKRFDRQGGMVFVPGDRQADGVFPYWSVERNLSASAYARVARRGLIQRHAEQQLAADWCTRFAVRLHSARDPIGALSGGNQQKVILARALAAGAELVLMDDPTRGVDIAAKQDIYELLRMEAAAGRSFVWYSTEHEELERCDRVYVFHERQVVGMLARHEFNEEAVLRMAFRHQP
jgi:ribose transport system ATP-binding protein